MNIRIITITIAATAAVAAVIVSSTRIRTGKEINQGVEIGASDTLVHLV